MLRAIVAVVSRRRTMVLVSPLLLREWGRWPIMPPSLAPELHMGRCQGRGTMSFVSPLLPWGRGLFLISPLFLAFRGREWRPFLELFGPGRKAACTDACMLFPLAAGLVPNRPSTGGPRGGETTEQAPVLLSFCPTPHTHPALPCLLVPQHRSALRCPPLGARTHCRHRASPVGMDPVAAPL